MSLKEIFFKTTKTETETVIKFDPFSVNLFFDFLAAFSVPCILITILFQSPYFLLILIEMVIMAGFFAINGTLGKAILERTIKKYSPLRFLLVTSAISSIILSLLLYLLPMHSMSIRKIPFALIFLFLFLFLFGFIEIKIIKSIKNPKDLFSTLIRFSFIVSIIYWATYLFGYAMST